MRNEIQTAIANLLRSRATFAERTATFADFDKFQLASLNIAFAVVRIGAFGPKTAGNLSLLQHDACTDRRTQYPLP